MPWIKGNFYTNYSQMNNNAVLVRDWLLKNDTGWTLNAIAGLLANMQQESGINPGIWQNLKPGKAGGGGWGLVQWTPWTNYTNWAREHRFADDSGPGQLTWIRDMTVPFGQWIPTSRYPMSFAEFKRSEEDAVYLARVFCANFERGTYGNRDEYAEYWWEFLSNDPDIDDQEPDPEPEPDPDNPWILPHEIRIHMPIYYYNLPWI